jgi:hypothetical protein
MTAVARAVSGPLLNGVFVARHHGDATIGVDRHGKRDWPATDGTVFDVLLVIDAAVDDDFDAFAAIGAIDIH